MEKPQFWQLWWKTIGTGKEGKRIGEVLIYRSDVAVDSPEASQADKMLDKLGYDINLERTKTTLRPEKLKDIKVKTPKDAKKFLKSALTGKDSRNLPEQLDDTMIIAFGPEVQIIPAKGKTYGLHLCCSQSAFKGCK